MDQQLGILGTPGVGFMALIVIGGLAGWIAGMLTGSRHWLLTNILIGICGSYVGSKLADITGYAIEGRLGHFVAALVGSVIILILWQMLHPRSAVAPR